jgi:translation initiation factor 2B subunit (eIF-2B alpha/beta/delta family)
VPHLATSLRRVYWEYDLGEEATAVLTRGISQLKNDHESGARVLAAQALAILQRLVETLEAAEAGDWWQKVRMAAWHLWKNGRESMGAAILNVMLASLELFEKVVPQYDRMTREQVVHALVKDLADYERKRNSFSDSISRAFGVHLSSTFPVDRPIRILTLSSSSTILRCLTDAIKDGDRDFDLRILESRPLFEGARMAAQLAAAVQAANANGNSQQHRITVFTDAAAAIAAHGADLVLLGADLVSAPGGVCNKTGSLAAVLCARHATPAARVTVVADSEKVFPFEAPGFEENDEAEVTRAWPEETAAALAGDRDQANPATTVRNVYFEWVPAGYITTYILEDGPKETTDIELIAKSVQHKAARFFDEL